MNYITGSKNGKMPLIFHIISRYIPLLQMSASGPNTLCSKNISGDSNVDEQDEF